MAGWGAVAVIRISALSVLDESPAGSDVASPRDDAPRPIRIQRRVRCQVVVVISPEPRGGQSGFEVQLMEAVLHQFGKTILRSLHPLVDECAGDDAVRVSEN